MNIQEYLSDLQSLLGSQTCQPLRLPMLYVSCVKLFQITQESSLTPLFCSHSVFNPSASAVNSTFRIIPIHTFLLLNHLSSYRSSPDSCLSVRRMWWPSEVFLPLLSFSVYAPQRRPSLNILSHPHSSSDIISFITSVITWIHI